MTLKQVMTKMSERKQWVSVQSKRFWERSWFKDELEMGMPDRKSMVGYSPDNSICGAGDHFQHRCHNFGGSAWPCD